MKNIHSLMAVLTDCAHQLGRDNNEEHIMNVSFTIELQRVATAKGEYNVNVKWACKDFIPFTIGEQSKSCFICGESDKSLIDAYAAMYKLYEETYEKHEHVKNLTELSEKEEEFLN